MWSILFFTFMIINVKYGPILVLQDMPFAAKSVPSDEYWCRRFNGFTTVISVTDTNKLQNLLMLCLVK